MSLGGEEHEARPGMLYYMPAELKHAVVARRRPRLPAHDVPHVSGAAAAGRARGGRPRSAGVGQLHPGDVLLGRHAVRARHLVDLGDRARRRVAERVARLAHGRARRRPSGRAGRGAPPRGRGGAAATRRAPRRRRRARSRRRAAGRRWRRRSRRPGRARRRRRTAPSWGRPSRGRPRATSSRRRRMAAPISASGPAAPQRDHGPGPAR